LLIGGEAGVRAEPHVTSAEQSPGNDCSLAVGAQRQNKTVSGEDCGYFIPVGDRESGHGGSNPPVTPQSLVP